MSGYGKLHHDLLRHVNLWHHVEFSEWPSIGLEFVVIWNCHPANLTQHDICMSSRCKCRLVWQEWRSTTPFTSDWRHSEVGWHPLLYYIKSIFSLPVSHLDYDLSPHKSRPSCETAKWFPWTRIICLSIRPIWYTHAPGIDRRTKQVIIELNLGIMFSIQQNMGW